MESFNAEQLRGLLVHNSSVESQNTNAYQLNPLGHKAVPSHLVQEYMAWKPQTGAFPRPQLLTPADLLPQLGVAQS